MDSRPGSDRPIADYALLSDCHSAALVSRGGSVDWLCLPRFDSPSIFGRLLDPGAGHWSIAPFGEHRSQRRYLPQSMVLETSFATGSGRATLTEGLVFDADERGHEIGLNAPHVLVRVLEVTAGHMAFDAEFAPRPEYGLVRPGLSVIDGGVLSRGGADILCLAGPPPGDVGDDGATWRLELVAGDRVGFALQYGPSSQPVPSPWKNKEIARRLDDTIAGWQSWSKLHQRYDGPWADLVQHSGRVLRALTYQPTGAIVAAPTTSLPELVGGGRNWDYRYGWIRDASLTMNALWIAACPDEASRFLDWIVCSAGTAPRPEHGLQIMYGVGGEHDLSERELGHLAGWRDSRPVRVGNGAWDQRQIDIFGELLDAVYRLQEQIGTPDASSCRFIARLADAAAAVWAEPDQGIWEVRGAPRHHLHSKLMCWVALDRAVKLAEWIGATERTSDWGRSRDEIRATILERGWNEKIGAFTGSFDSDDLDASALMLTISGFLPADDPRMRATIEAVARDLSDPSGLIWRYRNDDGLEGGESPFVLCTYWLVQCWALAGEVGEARRLFEVVTAFANDLGLLAEQADPQSGEMLGNFPQAFSHVGLVNAAWAISAADIGTALGTDVSGN